MCIQHVQVRTSTRLTIVYRSLVAITEIRTFQIRAAYGYFLVTLHLSAPSTLWTVKFSAFMLCMLYVVITISMYLQ